MSKTETTPYGRRIDTKGMRNGNQVRLACGFAPWVFNYLNDRAKRQEISFNACLQQLIEEAIEVDLECSLDSMGLHEIADMDELKIRFSGAP